MEVRGINHGRRAHDMGVLPVKSYPSRTIQPDLALVRYSKSLHTVVVAYSTVGY
jgi:hypothetical protein